MFTGIHSQNVHWHSLSKCSLAFTATSPFAQGEQTYLRIASHPASPSLLHIHSINNILRLPHLASYFYILKYLLLYAIYRILYIITLAQLSSIRSQIARHIRLDSLQSLVSLITPHQALVLFSSRKGALSTSRLCPPTHHIRFPTSGKPPKHIATGPWLLVYYMMTLLSRRYSHWG